MVCGLGVPLFHVMQEGRRGGNRHGENSLWFDNCSGSTFSRSHHAAFGVFDVKGSGRGHVIISGNLRERTAARCVVEGCDHRNNSVGTGETKCWLTGVVCVRARWVLTCHLVRNNRNMGSLVSVEVEPARVVTLQARDNAGADVYSKDTAEANSVQGSSR